jgi:hypothetical protein
MSATRPADIILFIPYQKNSRSSALVKRCWIALVESSDNAHAATDIAESLSISAVHATYMLESAYGLSLLW